MRSSQSGAPIMLNVDHMVYKALHENDCDVEIERSLCDFSPRKPYNYASFGTFNYIPEKKKRRMGKEEGAGSIIHVLVQFSCKSALSIL